MRVLLPSSFLLPSSVGKQSQLLLKPTEVELGLQVGVEFDNDGIFHSWSMMGPLTLAKWLL